MRRPFEVVSLLPSGPRDYDEVWELQRRAADRVRAGGPETVFLLEHRDVITLGRNAGTGDLHLPAEQLAKLGVAVRPSDRGGKLTFHGPGQLVAYPVLDLSHGETDVRRYVRNLEEVLILTVRAYGIEAGRSSVPERWSSVWVGNDKLAAIGIHLSNWVTTHGVALNVTTDLARFSLFTPCGIRDGGVTSIQKLRPGVPPPSVADVARTFVTCFSDVFDREPGPAGDEALAGTATTGGAT